MSRRQGETILIGEDIEIVIAHIGRTRVKVGIRAPRERAVAPGEVRLVRDEKRGRRRRRVLDRAHRPVGAPLAGFKLPALRTMRGTAGKKPDKEN